MTEDRQRGEFAAATSKLPAVGQSGIATAVVIDCFRERFGDLILVYFSSEDSRTDRVRLVG